MAQTSVDTTLRTALHTAINAAWTTETLIVDDPDFDTLVKDGPKLPYAICDLADEVGSESQGLKYDALEYVYSVSGVWARTEALDIKGFQQSRMNELLAQVTGVNGRLASIVRDQRMVQSYANLFSEPTEPVVTISLVIYLTVIESKS